jgi:hypothetical protein
MRGRSQESGVRSQNSGVDCASLLPYSPTLLLPKTISFVTHPSENCYIVGWAWLLC